MASQKKADPEQDLRQTLSSIERRIGRIEEYLGLSEKATLQVEGGRRVPKGREEDELEFELGQKWFAKVGIVVITIGLAFVLTFPYQDFPSVLPSLLGYGFVGGLFLLARVWRSSFQLISQYLVGSALVLGYFATLRFFFFSPHPPLTADSFLGILLLAGVISFNGFISLKRGSVYLTGLSLVMAYSAFLAVDQPAAVLIGNGIAAGFVTAVSLKYRWGSILLLGTILTYLTYLLWAVGNPFLGHEVGLIASPAISVWFLPLYAVILAAGSFQLESGEQENLRTVLGTALNAGGSYGIFLALTLASFSAAFVLSHIAASVVYLLVAVLFWTKHRSRFSTFLYAMLGYLGLSVALLKAFEPPTVFVWLSLQSILVLSTAIWFRSRFIVVANFGIYVAIVIGYLIVTEAENGMSIGFGAVALLSARILNWQQKRLELKTEMMRNAYLASAFLAFPYALYYLLPFQYVTLAWVGIALFYYLMSPVIKAQKYRWMGHFTLAGTVLYVMIIGIIQLEESYRILSFLVLGTVLIVVSLVFTRLRAKGKLKKSRRRS